MYKLGDYIKRGRKFLYNRTFPSRRKISSLMIYATDLCDSRCQHCLIWKKRPVKYLDKEVIFKLMESKAITPDTQVGLEGGEFLLHPQSREIMAWFRKNHPRFDLLSNCLKPDSLIEAVRASPPDRLFLSLDGDRETYQHMRGKDGYDKVLQVIEALKDEVFISVMFCLSEWNGPEALQHVAGICRKYGVDLRVGIYSNIEFFDTEKEAYREAQSWPVPEEVKAFDENFDYLLLYNEWKQGKLKMTCNSILDSVVILPNGDVPICLNLDTKLGNLHENSLDEILYSQDTLNTLHHHQHNCNACWINFHRKFDLILYRNLEKFFPKGVIRKVFGYYQWTENPATGYGKVLDKLRSQNSFPPKPVE